MLQKDIVQKDKRSLCKIIIPVFFFLVYGILDYLNLPLLVGVSVKRLNMDFFDIFLNTTVVLVLYIATYLFVDRRQIQKDKNAKETAEILMLYTYKECYDNLRMVCDTEWVETYIIPKIDGDKPPNDNRVVSNLQNFPFESKQELLELSKGGYIEKDVLKKYLHIQKEYKQMISLKITFYDLVNPKTEKQREFFISIAKRCDTLMNMLDEEIRRLDE